MANLATSVVLYLNNCICSQLLNKKDNFAKKCLKIIRFHTRPDVAGLRRHPEGELKLLLFSHS